MSLQYVMDFLIFVINMLQLANYDQITTIFKTLSYWNEAWI